MKKVDYKAMPKSPQKDNRKYVKRTFRYFLDREDWNFNWMGWSGKEGRWFCVDCHHSQDNMKNKCTFCQSTNIVQLDREARVPSKKRSKNIWKNFLNNFVYPLLKRK